MWRSFIFSSSGRFELKHACPKPGGCVGENKTQNSRHYIFIYLSMNIFDRVTGKHEGFLTNHCIRRKTPDKQMLLRQRSARESVCVWGRGMEIQPGSSCIKAPWWVCVAASDGKCVCQKMTRAKPSCSSELFVCIFKRKQWEAARGEKDRKDEVGMTRQ